MRPGKDKEIASKFIVLFMVGMLSIAVTLVMMVIPGSPYGIGQPGAAWVSLQLVSGLLLFWSGLTGSVVVQIAEVRTARQRQIALALVAQVVILLFFLVGVWSTYERLQQPLTAGVGVTGEAPVEVTGLGLLLAFLAFMTWVLSTGFLLRAYRLHRQPPRRRR